MAGSSTELRQAEVRKRRRESALIAVLAIGFTVLAILQARQGDPGSSPSSVTFFLLINASLILLLALIFFITRNLAKLVLERRRGTFGTSFQFRLVIVFLLLIAAPTSLLFLVSQGFISAAMDKWFGNRVERSLSAAVQIAEASYQRLGDDGLRLSRRLAAEIAEQRLLSPRREAELRSALSARREEWNLAHLAVFRRDASAVIVSRADLAKPGMPEAREIGALLESGADLARTELSGAGELVRTGVAIRDGDGAVVGAVVADAIVPKAMSRAALTTIKSQQKYNELKVIEQPVRTNYMISLVIITLVVIFSGTGLGMQLAREITNPIQRLGVGMLEVAHGNLAYRASVDGQPEIASLFQSFNQMTSDLERIHSTLEERHLYIENILANITAGVVSIDPGGAIATLNPAAARMLGLDPGDVQGRSWREVFAAPGLTAVGEIVRRLGDSGETAMETETKLAPSGREITAWVTATTLPDEAGKPGVMLFFEDVTHLMRMERMEAWREVARRIAHEIKNPLTPIQLSAQRLQKRYSATLPPEDRELLDECTRTIVDQVEQLKRLVNEFSRFARLPASELAAGDLNQVVEEALVLFREGHKDIAFEFSADPRLPPVDLDRNSIARAVINLLDNAVTACAIAAPVEGRIQLSTFFDSPASVARLEVCDNGRGMPPEVKARAFEPYFSTKKEGSGLGLAIVAAIVADHHGYVRVNDNLPHGTRIVIELPVRRGAERRVVASA